MGLPQIHLWCAFLREINDHAILEKYRKLLNAQEREQELRFHFAKDRRRYLVTRALVRTVLSRYVQILPEEWTFTRNRYGRPEASNHEALRSRLTFNVSHTEGFVLLGVAQGHALGVDAENIRAHEPPHGLADRYFSPSEAAVLTALPADQQSRRFFEYWTLKESYIKARGMGLHIGLDQFSFDFHADNGIGLSLRNEQNDSPDRWKFWQFLLESEFLVAVCAERVGRQPHSLTATQIVPLVSERRIDCVCLRSSEPSGDVKNPRAM